MRNWQRISGWVLILPRAWLADAAEEAMSFEWRQNLEFGIRRFDGHSPQPQKFSGPSGSCSERNQTQSWSEKNVTPQAGPWLTTCRPFHTAHEVFPAAAARRFSRLHGVGCSGLLRLKTRAGGAWMESRSLVGSKGSCFLVSPVTGTCRVVARCGMRCRRECS